MRGRGCVPDVVTYTALISAYEKGGQWRRALGAYEAMRAAKCKPGAMRFLQFRCVSPYTCQARCCATFCQSRARIGPPPQKKQ
jgi:pentatricopeptide repeat protein